MKTQTVFVEQAFVVDLPQSEAWTFLRNPQKLGACIPGVTNVDANADGSFGVLVEITLSLLTARFELLVKILEEDPPSIMVASLQGSDPKSRSVLLAQNSIGLRETSSGTEVSFSIDASLSGKLAALGGGSVIKLTSRKMARQFAERVKQQLEEQTAHAQ